MNMIIMIAYPFVVYFGLSYFAPKYIALITGIMFLLRFVVISSKSCSKILFLTTAAGIAISLLSALLNQSLIMKLYPVIVNILLFSLFFYSILHPPTIIERLVRIKSPNLPDNAIKYIKKVTFVWCGFFVINGFIALWTTLFSVDEVWVFYNGFLSYILIGVLFVTEFIYRQWLKRKDRISKCQPEYIL